MIVALRSGVPAQSWIEDPRALFTALEILEDADRRAQTRGR